MLWCLFAQALASLTSVLSGLDSEPSSSASLIVGGAPSSNVGSLELQSGTTSTPSTPCPATSSLPGSRAHRPAEPGSSEHKTTSGGFGRRSVTPFAVLDRATSSWRTPQASLMDTERSETYSGTWPRSGSMRSGRVFPRPVSAPLTDATGSSSLLPTPTRSTYGSNMGGSSGRVGVKRHSLDTLARMGLMLPTPTRKGDHNRPQVGTASGEGLATFLLQLLPTPLRSQRGDRGAGSVAAGGGQTTWGVLTSLLPTPVRSDGVKGPAKPGTRGGGDSLATALTHSVAGGSGVEGGPLSPSFVEWMMGAPNGWTDPNDAKPSETPSCRNKPSLSASDSDNWTR